jgi:hypothetical protein
MVDKTCSDNKCVDGMSLFNPLKAYMTNRTNLLQRESRFKMVLFRRKLYRRRHRASSITNNIGVWPEAIVDVPPIPWNNVELSYLSLAGVKYPPIGFFKTLTKFSHCSRPK